MSDDDDLVVHVEGECLGFAVRVAPRASRARVLGTHAGALKVALTAPPVDGAANAALVALLAERLSLPKSAIEIVRGHRTRLKRVRAIGASIEALRALAHPETT